MSQQINLFNPVFLKKNKLFSAVTMAQALGLLGIGLVGLGFLYSARLVHVRKDAEEAASRLKAAQLQLTQMAERTRPKQVDQKMDEEMKLAEARLRASRHVLDFVNKGDLGNTHGFAEFFRAFSRRATPGVWLTEFSLLDGGRDLEISGRAMQPTMVPAYLAALKQEALFRGKAFGSLELRAPQSQMSKEAAPLKAEMNVPYVEFTLKSADAVAEQGKPNVGQNEARAQ